MCSTCFRYRTSRHLSRFTNFILLLVISAASNCASNKAKHSVIFWDCSGRMLTNWLAVLLLFAASLIFAIVNTSLRCFSRRDHQFMVNDLRWFSRNTLNVQRPTINNQQSTLLDYVCFVVTLDPLHFAVQTRMNLLFKTERVLFFCYPPSISPLRTRSLDFRDDCHGGRL